MPISAAIADAFCLPGGLGGRGLVLGPATACRAGRAIQELGVAW